MALSANCKLEIAIYCYFRWQFEHNYSLLAVRPRLQAELAPQASVCFLIDPIQQAVLSIASETYCSMKTISINLSS